MPKKNQFDNDVSKYRKQFGGRDFTKASRDLRTRLANPSPLIIKRQQEIEANNRFFTQYEKYKYDPASYAQEVLHINFWEKQKQICEDLIKHRFVLCRSSHAVGKSYALGSLVSWAFDSWQPLAGIVTAPTKALVQDVAFAYTRTFRERSGLRDYFRGTVAPRLQTTSDHYIAGIVTSNPDSIQGRHLPNVFIAIDEAVGVEADMHEALESLYIGDEVFVVMFYNPTNPDAHVANLETQDGWHVITISCMEHPNLIVGLEHLKNGRNPNKELPFPGAITLGRFEQLLKQWSTEVDAHAYNPETDVILPSSTLKERVQYYKPGPIAESRLLGKWPSESFHNIFSEYIIDNGRSLIVPPDESAMPFIGVDCARLGDDFSALVVRIGPHIEEIITLNDQRTTALAGWAIDLANKYGNMYEVPFKDVPIAVDGIGIGAGVVDILFDAGYNVLDVNVSSRAYNVEHYHNLRSELWFELKERITDGEISLTHVSQNKFSDLRRQMLGPRFLFDSKGRRQVERKRETKKRTKRSPDIADALCLTIVCEDEFASGLTWSEDQFTSDYED